MPGPFFAYRRPRPAFPTQGGVPVLISRRAFTECCCIDPPLLNPFDFAIIRYIWTAEGGTDLDTRTALIELDELVNGDDVGWSRGFTVSGVSGDYLTWGDDNVLSTGAEAVVVDFNALTADFPSATEIKIRLRANWYSTRSSGDFTLQFATYLGGVISPDGTDFINVGGTLVQEINLASNVASNTAGNVDGDDCGILIYNPANKTANFEV